MPETVPIGSTDSGSPPDINASLGIDPAKLEAGRAKMEGAARSKVAGDEQALSSIDATQKKFLPKMEALVDREIAGVESGDLKRWDEDQQKGKYHTDPVVAFGSLGSVFGTIASAFTRNPMVNAMNASAAAMDAVKAHDDQSYQRAYKAWQDNAKLALERQKIVHEAYTDASSLLNTNMTAAETKLRVLAARFGDQQYLALIEAGMWPDAEKLLQARQKTALEMAESLPKIAAAHDERAFLRANGYDEKNPQSEESLAAYQKLRDRQLQFAEAENEGKTPAGRMMREFAKTAKEDGTFPTIDEKAAFYDKHFGIAGKGASSIANKFLTDWDATHPVDASASPEERAAADSAKYEALAKHMSAQKSTGASREATITDDDAKRMAQQYVAGDKTVRQNISRGITGPANITKMDHFVTEELKAQGLTGKDLAVRLAEYHGLIAGESALGRRTAGVEMFANEAYNTMQIAQDISHQFPRTEFPAINKALLAWQKGTGDPKAVEMGAAVNAVINTYAKAIAGGQQATVSDKDHAREVLEAAFTQTQFDAAINILKREIEAARKAPGQVKQEFRDLAGAGPAVESGKLPSAPNTIRYDKEGNRVSQ